jgi:menaquinone-dependent protoporphyrinogen oxidase
MKTAIIYSTTQGTTEKVANYIAEKLNDKDVDIIKLQKRKKNINLDRYERIILGGSIYLGDIQTVMSKFCNDNFDVLLTKTIGLFACGIERELVRQDSELEMAFPRKLYKHALATAFVGGEIIFDKLNPTQKFISKNMFKINDSVEFFEYNMMDIFIYQLQSV